MVTLALLALGVAAPASDAQPPPVQNVPYGSEPKQVMDVYPGSTPEATIVVMVHSGGWFKGDKKDISNRAAELQKKGFAVFNADYRLDAKGVPAFPMEVEDVESAVRYAIAHAAEYSANPANAILIGGSAGGQLVGSAAERLNAAAAGTVRAVVTLSGPSDLVRLLQDFHKGELSSALALDVRQALGCKTISACETPEKQAFGREWSPASQPASPCVPWLIFDSQNEVMPLDQPQGMTAHLEAEGCPVTETIVPGNRHAFAYWTTVKEQLIAFLQAN